MKNCDICPLMDGISDDNPLSLVLTDRWSLALDKNQSYLGKSYLTLREHKETISDLDETDWLELWNVMRWFEGSTKSSFGADVINWECLMNNAVLAEQSTHVHWHAYPRYRGGVTFAGQEFPDDKWPRHKEAVKNFVNESLIEQIANTLREYPYGN